MFELADTDLSWQNPITTRKATPEELEALDLKYGTVRKKKRQYMDTSYEVQQMVDEGKGIVGVMRELANAGHTLEETAEKMDMDVIRVRNIANLNGLAKIFSMNRDRKNGIPIEEEHELVKPTVQEMQEPQEEIKGVVNPNEDSIKAVPEKSEGKGVFEVAEEVVVKANKEKSLVNDMLSLAQKYNLDFVSGMVIQELLKGNIYGAKAYISAVTDGVKA